MTILDRDGKLLANEPPRVLSGSFCREAHALGTVSRKNEETMKLDHSSEFIRMQVPWLVSLLCYNSKLQLQPERIEMHIYAPPQQSVAVKAAYELWRWWWKCVPTRGATIEQELAAPEWPKIEDGAVAEETDDDTFVSAWRHVMLKGEARRTVRDGVVAFTKGFLAAGNQTDPWAFVDTSGDVRIYRAADFQEGLNFRI